MKNYKEYDVWLGSKIEQVLDDKYEVIERNEPNDSDKVRIEEFAATYLSIGHLFLKF